MSLSDLTVADLSDRTASAAPTPGGGSIACVAGALGAGLVVMAVEITKKSAPSAELDAWLVEARAKLAELHRHADADVAAFESYMAALAMSRDGEAEKAARKAALGAAALGATRAPLEAARAMLDALAFGVRAASFAKKTVASDVLAGADLLAGAVSAVLRNVDVNLPSIPDADTKAALAAERRDLEARGKAAREEIVRILSAP